MKEEKLIIWSPEWTGIKAQKRWIREEVKRVGEKNIWTLAYTAKLARENAYQPYSGYAVGAAVFCRSGQIYFACNTESVTYSGTYHAEQNAIAKAISEGETRRGREFITAIAVSHSGDSGPCGECRQKIAEHCGNCLIIIADDAGKLRWITSLHLLLPCSFGPSSLALK